MEVANRQKLRFYPCPVSELFHLGHAGLNNPQKAQPQDKEVFTGSVDELAELARAMRERQLEG